MTEVTNEQRQAAIQAMNARLREKLQYFHKLSTEDAEAHYTKTVENLEEIKREINLYSQVLAKKHNITVKSPWAMPSKEDRSNWKPTTNSTKSSKVKTESRTKSGRISKRGLSPRDKLLVSFIDTNEKMGMSHEEAKKTAEEQVKAMGL